MTALNKPTGLTLELEYPKPLGVFDSYPQAQRVVDYLSDNEFPVQNVVIVGTELRSVERVTGRITHGKVALAGLISGAWMGLFVGVAFTLFSTPSQPAYLITTPILGALFGLVLSQVGYRAATAGGARDFSSVTKVIATKYEVLVEHRLAETARALLAAMPTG